MKNVLIVLNYNDSITTIEFLKSVKDFNEIDKIVVVDNCSKDDSFSELKKYRSDKIHVIKSDYNGGYAYGNNFGIKYAIKKFNPIFLTIANPDIKFENKALKSIRKYLEGNSTIAAANIKIKNIDGHIEKPGWNLPSFKDDIKEMFIISRIFLGKKKSVIDNNISEFQIQDVLHGCFFVIKANIMLKIGLFDERTFLFGEERILGYKIKELGMKQATLLSEECIHEHSKSINKNISSVVEKYKILYDSRLIYYTQYLKLNNIKITLYKFVRKLSLLEKRVIYLIKEIVS